MDFQTWNEIINNGGYSQELDWFAIDKSNNVGMFSAIMNAPIPEKVKRSFDEYLLIKREISLLPKFSPYQLVTSMAGNFSDWIGYAEKGLFAFDFQDIHRAEKKNYYDLIAKPVHGIKADNLNFSEKFLENITKLDCDFSKGDLDIKLIENYRI
jgi:hypothetical protein